MAGTAPNDFKFQGRVDLQTNSQRGEIDTLEEIRREEPSPAGVMTRNGRVGQREGGICVLVVGVS
jgi:hypothetical protein